MCLSASRPYGRHYDLHPIIQAENGTYHNVAINIFDDEVTDIFDSGISPVLIKLKGAESPMLCWLDMDLGK